MHDWWCVCFTEHSKVDFSQPKHPNFFLPPAAPYQCVPLVCQEPGGHILTVLVWIAAVSDFIEFGKRLPNVFQTGKRVILSTRVLPGLQLKRKTVHKYFAHCMLLTYLIVSDKLG